MVRHVYVHVPFCARRCSYCDFAIAVRRVTPVNAYVRALAREISIRGRRANVDTIYLGGGTPSLIGATGVRQVLDVVRSTYTPAPDAEITLEANPDDVTVESAAAWRDAGVNRLSIGAQSFHENVLRWMHRTHDADAIGNAVHAARRAGFDNVSLDLIFALPQSLERDWTADLHRAIALAPEHISLYGLTVESATPLSRWRDRGKFSEAPEEAYESEYLAAHETLVSRGFDHYEVSNFARDGKRSRHNAAYWSGAAYEGLGPSAHRFDGAARAWNVRDYTDWSKKLEAGLDPTADRESLTAEQREIERAYLELRSTRGVELGAERSHRISTWIDAGWAQSEGSRARLTAAGWLRLDALAASLTENGSHCNV